MKISKGLFIRDKSFYKTLLMVALPIVFQNMITIGVNIMDTVMLGNYGEIQLSASSLANNFIDIFYVLHMGMGGGAAVLVSQYWGTKDLEGSKKVIAITFRMSLCVIILFTLITAIAPRGIMSLYSDDLQVIDKGRIYFLVSLPAYLLQGVSMVMTLTLRAMRKVMVSFAASVVSFFINVFFNWVFIFGNLGAPEMQIAGAALGTVLARAAEFLIIGVYFFFVEKQINFSFKDLFSSCRGQWLMFFRYGIPVIVSDFLVTMGNSCLSSIMGHIATNFVAAYSIVVPVMRLSNVFTMGLAQAAATMTGNIVGTGDREKSQQCGMTCLALALCTGLFASIAILLLGPSIVGIYRVEIYTKEIAYELMSSISLLMVFQAAQSVLTKGILRGGGDTRFVMIADALFMWILSIPLGYCCGLIWKLSPFIIYLALRSDFVVKTIWCTVRLLNGKWIKQIKKHGGVIKNAG